jgi:hypothetical protein
MHSIREAACLSRPQERRYRRFNLSYPVRVSFRSGELVSEIGAVTRNVSIGGLLLETAAPIPENSPVSFVITMLGGEIIRPIELVGEGEVVRIGGGAREGEFAIAVKCDSPITQMENLLGSAGQSGRRNHQLES